MKVNEEAIFTWMIRRLKLSNSLNKIVVCTSVNDEDTPLCEIAQKENVFCFRGSEEDVIQRLYDAAVFHELDYVINMTADCPLLPFDYIDELIQIFKNTNADLVKCHHLPVGLYLSGLKIEAMKKIIHLKNESYTEYWLYYFLKTDYFKVQEIPIKTNLIRDYRIALDYEEDWKVLKYIYQGLGQDAFKITTPKLIEYCDKNKEIFEWNRNCNEKGKIRTEEDPTSNVSLKVN